MDKNATRRPVASPKKIRPTFFFHTLRNYKLFGHTHMKIIFKPPFWPDIGNAMMPNALMGQNKYIKTTRTRNDIL